MVLAISQTEFSDREMNDTVLIHWYSVPQHEDIEQCHGIGQACAIHPLCADWPSSDDRWSSTATRSSLRPCVRSTSPAYTLADSADRPPHDERCYPSAPPFHPQSRQSGHGRRYRARSPPHSPTPRSSHTG